jgi:hypothetical protein
MDILGLKEAYESAKDRLNGMTLDEFVEETKDFEVTPVYYGGEVIGAILVKERHVHACIKPEFKGKWFGRVAVRIISEIVEKYGEALTSATTEDGIKIVESLGFVKDGDIYRSSKKWALNR